MTEEIEVPPRVPRKIAILGNATVSLDDAPYGDLSWKIWDMSNNFWAKKRFDLWFEIHTPEVLQAKRCPQQYFEFIKAAGDRLVAGHPSDMWPDAKQFPIHEIIARFGDYFTSSFAYMMAYALYMHEQDKLGGGEGIAEIGCWGVDMSVDEEYTHQKACAEYWIGMARGMGIKVHVAPESPVCRTNAMYGFENLKLSREFTDRLLDIDIQINALESDKRNLDTQLAQKNQDLAECKAIKRVLKQICARWAL